MNLRDQANARQGGGTVATTGGGMTPEQQEEYERREKLESRLARMQDRISQAMPGGNALQFQQDAATAFRTVKNLDRCEPLSVMGALMTIAQLGLRPGVNGQAWPMPFWNARERRYQAQVVIGYKGYTHLIWESGKVTDFVCRTVYKNDDFEIEMGTTERLLHKPFRGPLAERGPTTDYYFRWSTVYGGGSFFHMTHEEVLQWRDKYAKRSQSGGFTGVWGAEPGTTEFESMAWKTLIRRSVRFLPSSNGLATAAAVDETVRVDTNVVSNVEAVSQHPEREPIEGETVDPEREKDRAVARGIAEESRGENEMFPPGVPDPSEGGGWTGGER